jgi:integrating conjugative element membrane protein (TIGR03747 family)
MPSHAPIQPSVAFKSITWPFRLVFWVFMLTLLSWCMAMAIGLYFHFKVWEGEGVRPFEQALEQLILDAVSASVVGPLGLNAAHLTLMLSEGAYRVVFVWSGLEGAHFRALAGMTATVGDAAFYRWLVQHAQSVEVAMMITRLYGAKIAMLAGALPLFLIAYVVAMVDGLVARYIRKQGGGRESAFIYHRAKWGIVMLTGTAVIFLLLLPLNYSPRWILPGAAATIGLLARIQWAYYKKYL